MTPPNPERQIHRACGDVRVALLQALELLSDTTAPGVGDDVFRAFSDLGHVQQQVAMALHATNLLDQMVGTPAEQRRPWSYYRGRIGKKLLPGPQEPAVDCEAPRFDRFLVGEAACGSTSAGPDTRAPQPVSAPEKRTNLYALRTPPGVTTGSAKRSSDPDQKRPLVTRAAGMR
ncbi:MAG: hypothetical protein JOZ23_01570 [Mycobacterium sp.]|nr:hypothetical protein [Mycobacterium sp.]MBV9350214.1 hypothetical protein [Mycobacterium sp.]